MGGWGVIEVSQLRNKYVNLQYKVERRQFIRLSGRLELKISVTTELTY